MTSLESLDMTDLTQLDQVLLKIVMRFLQNGGALKVDLGTHKIASYTHYSVL
jgi:hypothetical protein